MRTWPGPTNSRRAAIADEQEALTDAEWRAGDIPPWRLRELSDAALLTAIEDGPSDGSWVSWACTYEALAKEAARRLRAVGTDSICGDHRDFAESVDGCVVCETNRRLQADVPDPAEDSQCPVCCAEAQDRSISSLGVGNWVFCAEHAGLGDWSEGVPRTVSDFSELGFHVAVASALFNVTQWAPGTSRHDNSLLLLIDALRSGVCFDDWSPGGRCTCGHTHDQHQFVNQPEYGSCMLDLCECDEFDRGASSEHSE